MIRRAQAVLARNADDFPGDAAVTVAAAYIRLIQQRMTAPPPVVKGKYAFVTNPVVMADTTRDLPYESQAELAMLKRANKQLERDRTRLVTGVLNEMAQQLYATPGGMKVALKTAIAAPAYALYTAVYGMTIDGEDADLLDRIFAGLDFAQFVLMSPPGVQIAKKMSLKQTILNSVEGFAKKYGLKPGVKGQPLMAEREFRVARLVERLGTAGDAIVARLYNANLAPDVKDRIRAQLERIGNSKVAANIRAKLALLAETSQAANLRRDIGLIDHWIKQQESLAWWENEVAQGRAQKIGNGRYRSGVRDAAGKFVPGKHEELVEWTITGSRKRIDTGLVNHEQKTVCIVDKAAQMDTVHINKGDILDKTKIDPKDPLTGKRYVDLVSKAYPGYAVKYVEYYWDEKAGDFVLGNVSLY
jgi:hypothetical protein